MAEGSDCSQRTLSQLEYSVALYLFYRCTHLSTQTPDIMYDTSTSAELWPVAAQLDFQRILLA